MIRTLFLALMAIFVASANSSVKGTVVDVTGKSVFLAQVQLLDPVDQKVLYETRVGPDGFRIEPVAPQSYFGRLQTRERLAAVPCGSGKLCGYGYGAISAPARLLYQSWHDFGAAN
jgi:hypothetical protein